MGMTGLADALMPLARLLPPETAHGLAVQALAQMKPAARVPDDPILAVTRWGLKFPNPVGLAAGFDKDARAFAGALGLGFGFVEIGSVTPMPQLGNPQPRLFRVPELRAVVNRMGFNSEGHNAAARRLEHRDRTRGIVGINLGKNKDQADAAADYVAGVRALGPLADYLVVNVSSPNTAGLRDLQGRRALEALLARVLPARDALINKPPLLLKIAPDLDEGARDDIAAVALASRIDGLIVSNTTIARPATPQRTHRHLAETGGLSGRPLFVRSNEILADMYRRTGGKIILVGVGGIESGRGAYTKIRAGASLVQLYTALIYGGPGLVARIKRELADCLRRDGFESVDAAVGADHR